MPVLTEAEITALKRDVERAIWLSRSHFRTATENLLDTLDAREERIKELEEALRGIRDYDGNVGEGNYQADEMRRIARQILENKGKEKKL